MGCTPRSWGVVHGSMDVHIRWTWRDALRAVPHEIPAQIKVIKSGVLHLLVDRLARFLGLGPWGHVSRYVPWHLDINGFLWLRVLLWALRLWRRNRRNGRRSHWGWVFRVQDVGIIKRSAQLCVGIPFGLWRWDSSALLTAALSCWMEGRKKKRGADISISIVASAVKSPSAPVLEYLTWERAWNRCWNMMWERDFEEHHISSKPTHI